MFRNSRRRSLAGVCLGLTAATWCGKTNVASVDCDRAASAEPWGVSASGMSGRYVITLVAEFGSRQGDSVRGTLEISPRPTEAGLGFAGVDTSVFGTPLAGSAQFDLAKVGALSPGDIGSRDSTMPGLVVIERRSPRSSVLVRLGSEANRTDRQRIDGTYTVLDVGWVEQGGFGGTWRSGAMSLTARGRFCATRTA